MVFIATKLARQELKGKKTLVIFDHEAD